MFPTSVAEWARFISLMGVKAKDLADWPEAFNDVVKLERFNLGEVEFDDYIAQMLYETNNLRTLEEDLNYRAPRIVELGKLYGPNSRWGAAARQADDLAWHPEALAEVLYGGRFGNDKPGDGWRYRGAGIPMVTFKANYAKLGELMGQDLVAVPELLHEKRYALEGSIFWWEDAIKDADIDHPERLRKLVQGSTLGVEQTRALAALARSML